MVDEVRHYGKRNEEKGQELPEAAESPACIADDHFLTCSSTILCTSSRSLEQRGQCLRRSTRRWRAGGKRRSQACSVGRQAILICGPVLLCGLSIVAASAFGGGDLEDDSMYNIEEDDIREARSSLAKFEEYLESTQEDGDNGGSQVDGKLAAETVLTEADKEAMNQSHAALLKVVSLSWPSEGSFGNKVAKGFPADQTRRYSWLRAQRKAFKVLVDSDMKSRSTGPSEEVLLALGYRYLHGIGTRRNCPQALECYNSVADSVAAYMEQHDSREAKLDLGVMRISLSEIDGILGEDVEDPAEALEFDRLSAQGGDLFALKEVGWRSLVGRGLEEDHAQALQHLEAAAAGGDPDAQHNLGYMYMNGLGVPRNMTKAKGYFDEAAKMNVTAALNALGYMHFRGAGVAKNVTLGEEYLRLAADRDDADAALNLAALYQELDGNMTRSLPLLEQAADAGFWRALVALADVHDMGIERPRNCTAAVVALKKMVETHGGVANELRAAVQAYKDGKVAEAQQMFCELAEQGVEVAQVAQSNCAWLYLKGRGLPPPVNHTLRMRAVRQMFERAGQQGGGDAHLRLGDMAWYGVGKEANSTAAAEHYLIAASRRSQQGSFSLGYLHQFGLGVARNLTLARRYYLKSGNRHHFTRYPANFALTLLAAQSAVEAVLESAVALEWGEGRSLLSKSAVAFLLPNDQAQRAAVSWGVLALFALSLVLLFLISSLVLFCLETAVLRPPPTHAPRHALRVPDIAAWLHPDDAVQNEAPNRRR